DRLLRLAERAKPGGLARARRRLRHARERIADEHAAPRARRQPGIRLVDGDPVEGARATARRHARRLEVERDARTCRRQLARRRDRDARWIRMLAAEHTREHLAAALR